MKVGTAFYDRGYHGAVEITSELGQKAKRFLVVPVSKEK